MNVYADHAATTPMRACAKEAMLEALEDFGNPSSIHSAGRLAAVRLESARKEVAELLNCRPSEIYFTSGGTEADNWAIRAARYGDGHVVASAFEHHAIIHALEAMAREKERHVELVKPERDGIVDPERVRRNVSQYTNLVTVMAANNEVGTIQPVEEIGRESERAETKERFSTRTQCRRWAISRWTFRKWAWICFLCPPTSLEAPRGWASCIAETGSFWTRSCSAEGKSEETDREQRTRRGSLPWRWPCVRLAKTWRAQRPRQGNCGTA